MDKTIELLDQIQNAFDRINSYTAEARETHTTMSKEDAEAVQDEMDLINNALEEFYSLNKDSNSGIK